MDFSTAEIVSSSDDPGTAEVITGATVVLCKAEDEKKYYKSSIKKSYFGLEHIKILPIHITSDKINWETTLQKWIFQFD